MFRTNFHEEAFAIRTNKGQKLDRSAFNKLLKEVAAEYPVTIEGITSRKRSTKKTYEPIAELGGIAIAKIRKEKRNMICVGISAEFDISFEQEKNIVIGGFYARVKVLDISKDREEIVERLGRYLSKRYPVTRTFIEVESRDTQEIEIVVEPAPKPKVTFHSTYVQVDDQVISWTEWERNKRYYTSEEKPREIVKFAAKEKERSIESVIKLLRK